MAAPGQVLRRTQAESWGLGNSQRSARLGSARLGSARLGSARLGSARLGSARLGSARLGSARLGSARLGSARLGSARLGSARLGSARLGSAHNSRFSTCVECQVFFRVIHNFFRSVPFRPGHHPRRRTHQEMWRGLEMSVDRIASDARVVSELARRRACGCKSCHGSLLRHASRAIVTSRPLREARDRQLRQTVPGGRR